MAMSKPKFILIDDTIINLNDIGCIVPDTDTNCIKVFQISDPDNPIKLFTGTSNTVNMINDIARKLRAIE